ncbi:MAG: Ig-like domain-containing protein [Verrucomicrobia bacterium]|nr:Ig-like domain-containing protein [Verrucomicrobiota bacterium]
MLVLWGLSATLAPQAQSVPKLVSVTPANGATDAAPRGPVVFVFDQVMDITAPLFASVPPFLVGSYEFAPNSVNALVGSGAKWGADRRTLTFTPSGAVPLNTTVTWTLNPAGTTAPLKSATGQPLAMTTGSYQIASNSGGSPSEVCPPVTPAPGSYVFTKFVQYLQTSALDPTLSPGKPALLAVQVQSPPAGPAVTGGSLTLPNGASKNLLSQIGFFRITESFDTEAALDAAYPVGNYTLHFNQTGETERVIPLALPVAPTVIPKILNYAEAQAIDATQDFTLQWNSFTPQGEGAVVRLVITDEFGNRIFLAPNSCVPRTLDPTATSIVIPANYLRPGFSYRGQLLFSVNFYKSTTDVAQMTGNGFVQRTTAFTLQTARSMVGPPDELCDPITPTLGSYTVTKLFSHNQTSAEEVVPQIGSPAFFSTTVASPPAGPAVTDGSLTLPSGTKKDLTSQFGFFNLSAQAATEAALEADYAAGSYTVRFNQTGQPERVIAMAMPATPAVIPKIVNYAEAQTIDATKDFTLQWNSFSPQGPGAFIRLIISDELGNLIFMAPNPCVPRTLDPTATSIVIPANYFIPGVNYRGLIQFGLEFYNSITEVPQMAGYGAVQRSTSFALNTAGTNGGGAVAPARFTGYRVSANTRPEFNLSGTAGKMYTIQRTGSLTSPAWSALAPVTMNASGTAVFEDADATLKFPAFYRAVGN